MAELIDGKQAAAALRGTVQQGVAAFQGTHGYAPGLATVLVGNDPASASYVRSKRKACAEVGIVSLPHELPATTSEPSTCPAASAPGMAWLSQTISRDRKSVV
jgi:methylenetetrahydrofolate dehydrogenase (NADP+)/methenyltetrahydrofolate cyclohydrolase